MLEPPPARAAVPPSPLPWAASAQGKPMHWRPNPDASRAKQAPLPPPCRRHHRCRRPWMHPQAPLALPHLCPGLQAYSASHRISGPTPTQAKQSKHCSSPPCQCRHHRRCPRICPRAPLTFPHLCLEPQACSASHCIAARPRRKPSKARAAAPPPCHPGSRVCSAS
jgi:hypothetical protein